MKFIIITCLMALLVLLVLSGWAFAFYECFFDAGKRYHVDPYLLVSIAKVESNFNPQAVNINRNGSVDYGIMQINSYWLYYYRIPMEWIKNPCYNIHFGAMVLRRCMDANGNNLSLAIDCYNRGSKANAESQYVIKVYRNYKRIKQMVR
ncbi:MAG: lytic transglycosylase domain-containing protein [Hydrogenobacter thermophilus]|nr:MAG: lytic transglycosylase domain-containing protein [Hydrogenobacter thermophilus]